MLVKPYPKDNDYLITSNGDVYSIKRKKLHKLSLVEDKKGYLVVNISSKLNYVHRLIAETFLKDWDESLEVNHKNFVRNDNRLKNLEMCTASNNQQHAYEFGRKGNNPYKEFMVLDDEYYTEDDYEEDIAQWKRTAGIK